MKRAAEDSTAGVGDGEGKEQELRLRVLLPTADMEPLLGADLGQISRLEAQSGCKLELAQLDSTPDERLLTLLGESAAASKAVELMLSALAAPRHVLRCVFNNHEAGRIIGKGGASIRQIRSNTAATIEIPRDGVHALGRLVLIKGQAEQIAQALLLIASEIAGLAQDDGRAVNMNSAPKRRAMQPPEASYGSHAAYAPPQYSAPPAWPYGAPPPPYAQTPYHPMYGYPPADPASLPHPDGGYIQPAADLYHPLMQPPPPYGTSAGGAPPGSYNAAGNFEQLLSQDQAGRMIGRGGEGIKALREQSGAGVKIEANCEPGTEFRKLTVSGHPAAVGQAIALVQARLADMANRPPLGS